MSTIRFSRRALCASGTLLLLAGCAGVKESASTAPVIRLEGTALYRERMALPPEARLEVQVEDVSRADAPAEVLGNATVRGTLSPPIRFTIEYPANQIVAGHRYGVRARIMNGDELMFTTDTFHALPPIGSTAPLELLLVRASASAPTATLVNTYWKLLRLGTKPVEVVDNEREPHMILRSPENGEQRVSGYAGCNAMTGSYSVEAENIGFTQMAGTMRACAQEAMDTEQGFHQALAAARKWEIRGEQLSLLDADGKDLALFESRYLR